MQICCHFTVRKHEILLEYVTIPHGNPMGITLLKYLSSEKAEAYPHCIKYLVSPNFVVLQFCGKVQVPHSFWRIDRNSAEIVPFHKMSTREN